MDEGLLKLKLLIYPLDPFEVEKRIKDVLLPYKDFNVTDSLKEEIIEAINNEVRKMTEERPVWNTSILGYDLSQKGKPHKGGEPIPAIKEKDDKPSK